MEAIPNVKGGVQVHRSSPTSDLITTSRQRVGQTPKPPETARFDHDVMSSLQNKAAIIEQLCKAIGFEAALHEEVAARHRADSSLGDRCDRLEMFLLALCSHCIPEGGEAITLSEPLTDLEATVKVATLSKRLDNLESKFKTSLDELNTQLETLRHAHAGLAKAHNGLEACFESSYAALQGQQESLRYCHPGFSREFEVVKQAQSSHASRLLDLDNATKELSGTMAVANINIAACLLQTSALEDHIVALMKQSALLEKSIDTLGSNNRSSGNSSPQALPAIKDGLAVIGREHAFLPSAAEERLSTIEKEYTSLPLAFGAVDKSLTAIEREHCLVSHGHLTLSPFETGPVQSPIPSPASTTMQIAEACSFSVGSEDSNEGIESVEAVSVGSRKLDDDVEGAAPNQPLEDLWQNGCVADDADPRIIAQQNLAVAMKILKIAQQKKQDQQQPIFLNISARVVKGIASCFPVTG